MDLIALLIAALSLLVSFASVVWAVHATKGSNKSAQDAIDKAEAANQLSAEANVIAEDSKSIAVDSRKIGEEALAVARRTELRESDTSNIHWEGDWKEPGTYVITNKGDDEALNVRIILTVDEVEIRCSEESIPGGGCVEIDCPQAKNTYFRELSEYRSKKRAYEQGGGMSQFMMPPNTLEYTHHFIGERIDWVSRAGKPGVHDQSYGLSSLGDFD
ncbi:hypothetical protein [Glutamicibacter nicotianae]|uniref:hypothetical protein n=1 Tax=Glutamicibacter nicotianae TaxID=37929 RepID=UPI002556E1FD|nr:hypothetical protein [Glutamicibacter nicotianae]WIV44505.1 hypothetical protein QQS42_02475 [Glutamicibacter nicotianae]